MLWRSPSVRDNARPHPGPLNTDFGRDIALRCPRPRSSGRHRCAAERGADGAARRPYQVQGFNARNFSGKPLHEPPLSRPSATLSPLCGERAGRGVPIWFMVPMHAEKRKEAFHEPGGARLRRALFSILGDQGGVAPHRS